MVQWTNPYHSIYFPWVSKKKQGNCSTCVKLMNDNISLVSILEFDETGPPHW